MKILKNVLAILIPLTLFISSCSSPDEEEEKDPYADRQADFYPRKDFHIGQHYDYFSANKQGYEGTVRRQKEMSQHRPLIEVQENGAKLTISFPDHPHKPGHYWAWFEIIDQSGTEFYEELPPPQKNNKEFKFIVIPEKPFQHRIRLRAFCFVHGEFLEYFDLQKTEKKSLIDP